MTCDQLQSDQTCAVATNWAGLATPVTSAACKVCQGCPKPKQLNRVTASLAVAATRAAKPEALEEVLQKSLPYLVDHPGVIESAERYLSATHEWIRQGAPTRSDEATLAIFQTCQGCDKFRQTVPGAGTCKLCGCGINQAGGVFNKARRSNEHCPLGKW